MLFEKLREGRNRELEVLRLQYDEIDAKGVKALVDAQDGLPKMRRVELNGNKFDEEDPAIEELRGKLDERREQAGSGVGEGEDDYWGIDELDDLEEVSDEEDEGEQEPEDEDEDVEDKADRELKQADEAENENVPQEKDSEIDDLAERLGKTGI